MLWRPCLLFECLQTKRFKPFKPSRKPFQGNSRSHPPQPSVFKGVQACRLRARKRFKPFQPFRTPFHATLAATRPSHLFLRAFKPAVCPPSNASNPSNPSVGFSKATLAATRPSHLFLRAFKRLPFASLQTLKTPKTLQIPRGSFHQAFWPQAFAVPALQPAVCLHSPLLLKRPSLPFANLQTLKTPKTLQIPRGSFHRAL